MVGTDMTFLDIIGWFLTLQEAGGIRQPHWRDEASLSLCFEEKKRKQSGTDLQAVQSCVDVKERGALSLLKVKIASSPTMTYSHQFSTSPTTSPSPPSRTQQLFEWSTVGYIQCRYECLKTRMRIKVLQRSWGEIPRCPSKRHCTFLTLPFGGFCRTRFRLKEAPVLTSPTRAVVDAHQCNMEHLAQKHNFLFLLIRQNGGCILKSK